MGRYKQTLEIKLVTTYPMHLSDNTLLQGGKYKIVRYISHGGFGCTYEGLHVLLKKRVAIKEFFVKDFCNRDETTAHVTVGITAKTALVNKLKNKFIEEAQAVNALKHSHIVNVFDVFEENGTAYYVMDYIDGQSLNDMVKRNRAMNEEKALKYILQVADALKYVHSRNRLHLDVKPGNIMVDEEDNAILIDFGASKQYDEEDGENTSTLMGKTPGYAPLEQMGNDVVKFYPSTDIYALGATLYKLLTGITPPSATLLASGEELQPIPSSISENVRNAVFKAMQTNKNKRPRSIDEFLQILNTSAEDDHTVFDDEEDDKDDKTEVTIGEDEDKPTTIKLPKNVIFAVVGVAVLSCIGGIIGYNVYNEPKSITAVEDTTTIRQVQEAVSQIKEHVTGQTFKDAKGRDFTYTGEVADSKPNGKGTGIYSYGTYTGEYQNGVKHGEGKFESKDGSNKFEGSFYDDKYNKGTLTMSDGSYYVGTFSGGQPYTGKWYDKNGMLDSEVVKGQEKAQTTITSSSPKSKVSESTKKSPDPSGKKRKL